MQIIPITKIDQVQTGDNLLIEAKDYMDKYEVEGGINLFKSVTVKVSERDHTEIILRKKGNVYFNLDMYLNDKSWVKAACIVKDDL